MVGIPVFGGLGAKDGSAGLDISAGVAGVNSGEGPGEEWEGKAA